MTTPGVRCPPLVRKMAVGIAGFAVLGAGLALIVLPGPAVVVIPIGLAILGKEFPWARSLLAWSKRCTRQSLDRARRMFSRQARNAV